MNSIIIEPHTQRAIFCQLYPPSPLRQRLIYIKMLVPKILHVADMIHLICNMLHFVELPQSRCLLLLAELRFFTQKEGYFALKSLCLANFTKNQMQRKYSCPNASDVIPESIASVLIAVIFHYRTLKCNLICLRIIIPKSLTLMPK